MVVSRLAVKKTHKLYIGGKFPRSESGRSYPALDAAGEVVARVAWASRKDLRDAVRSARGAQPGWAGLTAYNRGQILYRVAEMIEDRAATFTEQVAFTGATVAEAEAEIGAAVDSTVWYAGWADKFAQIHGNLNPVAGPFFNISAPEPSGVIGVVAPALPSLLGLLHRVLPVIVSGNTAVVIASESWPVPAVSLTEVFATSDLPGGVVNLLTGPPAELHPVPRRAHGRRRHRPHRGRSRADGGGVVLGRREREAGGGRARPARPEPVLHRRLHRDQDGLAPQGPVNPMHPARWALPVALAVVLTLPSCTADEEIPEPAAAESCDSLVDVGTQLVRAYARLFEQVRVEDLADGTEIPELDELERVGDELDASVARLGCDPADLNTRIAAEVGDLAAESPAASVLLEVVRRGVITEGATDGPSTTGGAGSPSTTNG